MFALSATLVSFEWRTPYVEPIVSEPISDIPESPRGDIVILPDAKKKIKEPEPPKPPVEKSSEIKLTDNATAEKASDTKLEFYDPDLDGLDAGGEEPEVVDPPLAPLDRADENPSYCGGDVALMQFLMSNLKYPKVPLDNGMQGTVYVKFVVGKDGKLRDAKVVRPLDPWLDAEALRVSKMLDCFTPGKQAGKMVDVYFVLPVRFVIK